MLKRSSLAQRISLIVWRVSSSLRSVKSLAHTLLVEKEPSALPGAFQIPLRTWVHWHGLFQLLVICFGHWDGIGFNTSKLNILPKGKQQTLLFLPTLFLLCLPLTQILGLLVLRINLREFLGGSVVMTRGLHCHWPGFNSWLGNLRFHKLYGPPKKNKL